MTPTRDGPEVWKQAATHDQSKFKSDYDPRHLASAALTYEDVHGRRVSTDARWISATAWADPAHTNPGFPYQASADPHFAPDLAATYPVRKEFEASANPEPLEPALYRKSATL